MLVVSAAEGTASDMRHDAALYYMVLPPIASGHSWADHVTHSMSFCMCVLACRDTESLFLYG